MNQDVSLEIASHVCEEEYLRNGSIAISMADLPRSNNSHKRWRLDLGGKSYFVKACGCRGFYDEAREYWRRGGVPAFSDEPEAYGKLGVVLNEVMQKPLALVERKELRYLVLPWLSGILLQDYAYGSDPWLATAEALGNMSLGVRHLDARWIMNSNPMLGHSGPKDCYASGAEAAGCISPKLYALIQKNGTGYIKDIASAKCSGTSIVHGQIYAKNVMITPDLRSPVILDWESYDCGPQYFDLASLVSGRGWFESGRAAMLEAFYASVSRKVRVPRQEFEEAVGATEVFHQFRLLSVLPSSFWEPPRIENAIAILSARRN